MKTRILFISILFSILIFPQPKGPIPAITSGYGANGTYTAVADSFPNSIYSDAQVYTFKPSGVSQKMPVIFFCHGYGALYPQLYSTYINHMVSKGYMVIFSTYPSFIGAVLGLYDIMYNGFLQAVDKNKEVIDTTKIGLVGHSFGAGSLPCMALRFSQLGWGQTSMFMLSHAPWYSYDLTNDQLKNFPSNCKLVMEVYENDVTNDHRMAKDIFENISISKDEKDFILVYSDSSASLNYKLMANHLTPLCSYEGYDSGVEDGLDYYADWKIFDALADYSFNNNLEGKKVALGNGNDEQTYMGTWPAPESRLVKRMYAGDSVIILHDESYTQWNWSNAANPRKDMVDVYEKVLPVSDYKLEQNYPNPFNPTTLISYYLPENSWVKLKVFNCMGEEIATLANEEESIGKHTYTFKSSGLASGFYFYRLETKNFSETKKMLLLK